jgi:flagellar biosynthesis protein FlhG
MIEAPSHIEKSKQSFISEILEAPFFTELLEDTAPVSKSDEVTTTRCLWLLSGKGGVGKSFIAANLASELTETGLKVLLIDMTTLHGTAHFFEVCGQLLTLHDLCTQDSSLQDATVTDSSDVHILHCEPSVFMEKNEVSDQFFQEFNVVLIDSDKGYPTTADTSWKFKNFVVISSPEPASITNSYSVIKYTSLKIPSANPIGLIMNRVTSSSEGEQVFNLLNDIAQRHIGQTINFFGSVNSLDKVRR